MAFLKFLSMALDLSNGSGLDELSDLNPLPPSVDDDTLLELRTFCVGPLAGGGVGGAGGGGFA